MPSASPSSPRRACCSSGSASSSSSTSPYTGSLAAASWSASWVRSPLPQRQPPERLPFPDPARRRPPGQRCRTGLCITALPVVDRLPFRDPETVSHQRELLGMRALPREVVRDHQLRSTLHVGPKLVDEDVLVVVATPLHPLHDLEPGAPEVGRLEADGIFVPHSPRWRSVVVAKWPRSEAEHWRHPRLASCGRWWRARTSSSRTAARWS